MTNISSNNVEIVVTINGLPVKLDHLASEGDVWVKANDPELGAAERTADGKLLVYGKNDLINYTLTLSAGSKQAILIMNALQAQMKIGKAPAVLTKIVVVVKTDSFITTYGDGILLSGPLSHDVGKDKLLDLSWTFSFEKVLIVPLNNAM